MKIKENGRKNRDLEKKKNKFDAIVWPHCTGIALNTSYLTDSYIVFTLKMESVSKNTIFGLKIMVKSGLEKMCLKFSIENVGIPSWQ